MDKTYTTHVDVTLDDDTHVTGQNNIPMAFPDVTKAYFAWCQQKPKKVDKKENGKMVRDEKGKIVKETKNNIILSEIDTGIYSNQYYIVVETKNFPDKDSEDRKITISLHSKNGILSTKDAAIELTYVDADATTKELLFNNFYKDDNIHNKDSFKNKAVYEITLSPTDETKRKTWIDKLSGGKQEALYIKVEVSGVDGILYQGKELKDNENCNKFLLDNPVNIYRCYCNRDITAKEIEYVVSELTGKLYNSSSFFAGNRFVSHVNKSDRSSLKFAEALNATFKEYDMNTCTQKSHFLAQCAVETGDFDTLHEGDSVYRKKYAPFYGMGLIHLTDETLLSYYDYRNGTNYLSAYRQVFPIIKTKLITEKANAQILLENEKKKAKPNEEIIKQQNDIIIDCDKYLDNAIFIVRNKPYLHKLSAEDKKKKSSAFLEIVDNYDQFETKVIGFVSNLEKDIMEATKASGWFWSEFKKIYNGNMAESEKTSKSDVVGKSLKNAADYGDKFKTTICITVNGGTHGMSERLNNYEKLITKIFHYQEACINYENRKK